EVAQSLDEGFAVAGVQRPAPSAVGHVAHGLQKALDPPMAIHQQPQRLIKAVIRGLTDLYGHCQSSRLNPASLGRLGPSPRGTGLLPRGPPPRPPRFVTPATPSAANSLGWGSLADGFTAAFFRASVISTLALV